MRQRTSSEQFRSRTRAKRYKTRNERRREQIEGIITGIVLFVFCCAVCLFLSGMFCKTWVEHPAEQPVNGSEYIELLEKCGDGYAVD